MAVASSGSVSCTTTNRAASPALASNGLGDPAGTPDTWRSVAGPATSATPGCLASSCWNRVRAVIWEATPGPMTRMSVGDKMPGAKPFAAASCADLAGDEAGSSLTSGEPRRGCRAAKASASRPAVHATAAIRATGQAAANRARPLARTLGGDRRGTFAPSRLLAASPAGAGPAVTRPAVTGPEGGRRRDGTDRNSRPPNTAISAGAKVIDTTIAVSTVSASAGPNSRSDRFWATASEAVVAATMRPAARMIGTNSAVASRAAGSLRTPAPRPARMPDRKNTE
jgi:hypothetical protein